MSNSVSCFQELQAKLFRTRHSLFPKYSNGMRRDEVVTSEQIAAITLLVKGGEAKKQIANVIGDLLRSVQRCTVC